MPFDVVCAYTLVIGDEKSPPAVGVYASAEEAWRALDQEVRLRCRMRARPRRAVDPDAVARLADAWRATERGSRYWQIRPHQLPVMIPVTAAPTAPAAAAAGTPARSRRARRPARPAAATA